MRIDINDLAHKVFGSPQSAFAAPSQTTALGTAAGDSENGMVPVYIDAEVITDERNPDDTQAIMVPTTQDAREGDSVIVSIDGTGHSVVTGVVGGGDRTKADIQAVTDSLAETDAGLAAVRSDADAHEAEIASVKQDIADYKASAKATYATKTDVDSKTGAITKTLTADYTKTTDLASTDAVRDAKSAGTTAQSQLADYKTTNDAAVAAAKKSGDDAAAALADYQGVVTETYVEKTELTEAVNQLSSTMTSNYSAFTDYRKTNDAALSKAQSDAINAQSTIDSYKSATNQRLDELKNIADNAIESFYLKGAPSATNPPASGWTTDTLKKQHAGDLYMDTDTGYSYRWSGTEWVQVKDSDVTKALKEIESVKTTYATKSELKATDTELSGKVSDSLTTAKSYTDSSISTEVTNRNAAIKAQADSINLSVSKTYTKYETFSSYQEDADGRIATANANASTAVSTAKTAASDAATAKTNASTAVSTANDASTSASNAVKTANAASSSADSAVTTANAANSTAQDANTTAQTANATADTAKSTADTAKSTAETAKDTADDAYSRTLRVQVSSTPADAAGDTSKLTATVWRGGEQLSDKTVAKMGLLAWYVGGSRVATGSTYTCAAGTATECRLEA